MLTEMKGYVLENRVFADRGKDKAVLPKGSR